MTERLAAIGIVGLVMLLVMSVCGCTTSQNTQQNQTAQLNNAISIAAKSVESPQQFNVSTPSPGNKYVLYNVTLTNMNARDRQVSPLFFALHDANNNVYNIHQLIQSRYLSQAFPYGYTITQPGDKMSGRIVFEVPQNAKLVTLTYDDHLVELDKYTSVTVKLSEL